MKLMSKHVRPSAVLCAWVASVVLVGAALPNRRSRVARGGGGAPSGGPGRRSRRAGPGGGGPGGGGPGGGGPGGAAPTPNFVLRMCNKTNDVPVIFVATASVVGTTIPCARLDPGPGRPVRGGWLVPAADRVLACAIAERRHLGRHQVRRRSVREPEWRVRLFLGWLPPHMRAERIRRAVRQARHPAERQHLRYEPELDRRHARQSKGAVR